MEKNKSDFNKGIKDLTNIDPKNSKPIAVTAIVFNGITILTATLLLIGFILAANFTEWSLDLKHPVFLAGAISWLVTQVITIILSVITAVNAGKNNFRRAADILILGSVLMAIVPVILPYVANLAGYILCIIGCSNFLYHLKHRNKEKKE